MASENRPKHWPTVEADLAEGLADYDHQALVTEDGRKIRICITGAAGFIASHLARRLKKEGHYIVAVDWKRNEYMPTKDFCDEFHQLDCRSIKNCLKVTKDCEMVFNLAADMGGMGFIKSCEFTLMFNNTMITASVLEAARRNGAKKIFYSSSACCYNELNQKSTTDISLKEDSAWPAQPQDEYGLEKLYGEVMATSFYKGGKQLAAEGKIDYHMEVRIARFHNVYGPLGTWCGGREKVPAAFCRKATAATDSFEIWGDGKAVRSFMYIEDCVEGVIRIMNSDCTDPINLGSDEAFTVQGVAELALQLVGKKDVKFDHVDGPEGVRGRNSDNTFIKKTLGWAPSIPFSKGMARTLEWIQHQMRQPKHVGKNFHKSTICQQTTETLDRFMG